MSSRSCKRPWARAKRPRYVAWLDAKPWQRHAFVEPLVAAIRAIRPDFGRLTLGAVAAGAPIDHTAAAFTRELGHLADPLLVLIDDAQVFAEDARFTSFLDIVLRDLPARVRFVASGRALPAPPLGELLASRRAARIDAALFAFDEAEIVALAGVLGQPIDAARAHEIGAATGGWAAAVVLALLDPSGLAGGTRSAAAYLREQLLPALPADLITFLEETSVCETLDLQVLERTARHAHARRQIAQLRHAGALVTELPGDRFRVHPMLRDLAADRLAARAGASAAQAVAAQAYAAAGDVRAALFHALAAGGADAGAALLRAHADAAAATGDDERLRTLVERIDPAGPDRDVRWYVEALLAKARGSQTARELFVRAGAAADDTGDATIAFSARAQTLEYDLGHLQADSDLAVADVLERAARLDGAAVARATMLRGWSQAIAHDFPAALATIAALTNRGDPIAQFNSAILQAYAQTALGTIDAAERTLDALVRSLETGDHATLQTLALIWLACWARARSRRMSNAFSISSTCARVRVPSPRPFDSAPSGSTTPKPKPNAVQ